MNSKRSCWFRVLYLTVFLICNNIAEVRNAVVSPAGTFTTTYTVFPTSIIPTSSILINDLCAQGLDNCDRDHGNCTYTGSNTYNCTCDTGYSGTGEGTLGCTDVDECTINNPCATSRSTCTNTLGSYYCTCLTGYENPNTCTDINECIITNECNTQTSVCNNTAGDYYCDCKNETTANYKRGSTNKRCVDVDECTLDSSLYCGNGTCLNQAGSYTCTCPFGYLFNSIAKICGDVNECLDTTGVFTCQTYTTCVNSVGSYSCQPDSGFAYSDSVSGQVIDTNECTTGTNDCHFNATCANNPGSYDCTCKTGFTGNGTVCADVNECATTSTHECDQYATCTNTVGSYTCKCNSGFSGTGRGIESCLNINECTNTPCPSTATCQDTTGSYTCSCLSGYENSPNCTDINECQGVYVCHTDANCINNPGSYQCTCKSGYSGSGTSCYDINECDQNICASTATCANSPGNYTCTCSNGYTGNGVVCTDINECNNNPCNQTCTNYAGGFQCSCGSGYTFSSPYDCNDIDECLTPNICQQNSTCVNSIGSYKCLCNSGYIEDNIISTTGVASKACRVDHFVAGYTQCPFMQNLDLISPERLIQIPEGIPFGGILQYDFYVCVNGIISVQSDLCHSNPTGNLGSEMINGTVFAPFYSDVDTTIPPSTTATLSNRVYSCKFTAVDPDAVGAGIMTAAESKIQEHVRETTNFTTFVPRNTVVATWFEVVPYQSVGATGDTGSSNYFAAGEKATFQAVITSDGAYTVVYYIYHNMIWSDNKGFRVQVGSRYNPTVTLIPSPPSQYTRLRFDKAEFTNPNMIKGIGYVSFQVSNFVNTQAVKNCDKWYDYQPTKALIDNLFSNSTTGAQSQITSNKMLTDCACTLTQTLAEDVYEMEPVSAQRKSDIDNCHQAGIGWDKTKCDNLNDGTNTCFVRRGVLTPDSSFGFNYTISTRCCFKTKTGSLDYSKSESGYGLNTQNHLIPNDNHGNVSTAALAIARDIAAHRYCCLKTPLCNRYDAKTRIPTCAYHSSSSRSTTFGDPHIMTLDGTQYTFNGLGDYWLVTTNDSKISLNIQARTCQARKTDGSKSPATIFCGFAFKENGQPTFEVYHNFSGGDPTYYIDGVIKPLASSTEKKTAVIYSTKPNKELKFIFPSETVFAVQIATTMLQSVVVASIHIQGKTVGLLGNVNGKKFDDYINRFTGNTISSTSSEERIYYDFGQSWQVKDHETLFRVNHTANLTTYQPLFWTNVSHMMGYNESKVNYTREFCGAEATNKECYFDFAITGNKEMAQSGKKMIEHSKSIIAAVARQPPKVTGPTLINVTKNIAINFTITAISNSTNMTYFLITNFTDSFTLLNSKTGLVNFHPKTNNETVIFGVIDGFLNAGTLQPKVIICDCIHGNCHYSVPELLGNLGNIYNTLAQCSCNPGYTGFKCESFIDSCMLDPCFTNVTCTMFPNRTSTCDPCPAGFSGDGRKCHDIDDCSINPCEQTCVNTVGSYKCECKSGFVKEGKHNCTDINECVNTTQHNNLSTICSSKQNTFCKNTEGSFKCPCSPGWRLNVTMKECQDIDECVEKSSGCQHFCHNSLGSYSCSCKSGTNLNSDNRTCTDINECLDTSLNNCDPNAKCTNIYESYQCDCKTPSFAGNGTYCADVDECNATVRNNIGLTTKCEVYCTNLVGSYKCSCHSNQQLSTDNHNCIQKLNPCIQVGKNPCDKNSRCNFNMTTDIINCTCNTGYTGNGTSTSTVCQDNDECLTTNICGNFSICNNTIGSYLCSCQNGYKKNVKKNTCEDVNECIYGLANCPGNSSCKNTQGSYSCVCNKGLVLTNGKCIDIDECKTNNGACSQVCTNSFGSHTCSCRKGYRINTLNKTACNDIDECILNAPCSTKAKCKNTLGSYNCTCQKGYSGNGTYCSDLNECTTSKPCAQTCNNTLGSYSCSCRSGYSLLQGGTCTDIDECRMGKSNCNLTMTQCINRVGGFSCREKCPNFCNQNCNDTTTGYKCWCKPGYVLSGLHTCSDINECNGTNDCHSLATCTNLNGSYACNCSTGYSGDGRSQCKDINECALNNGGCHSNATCSNTVGSFKCKCFNGFDGNGTYCVDTNECKTDQGGCHKYATCVNLIGSHSCLCNSGFTGNGTYCKDINECGSNNGGCHANATCSNTVGSFKCACKKGFSGDGKNCKDINECDSNRGGCHVNATCTNLVGSHKCACKAGFDGNGTNCVDRNECTLSNKGGCHVNATCTNLVGSHKCACKPGFTGNGINCVDINECLSNKGGCHAEATCINKIGSHSCQCRNGFIGNGTYCKDEDECQSNNGGCHADATCNNTVGSFNCACKKGFSGNGKNCNDINECNSNRGGCHVNATCTNLVGSHKCACKPGFDGNGINCVDRNECLNSGHKCHVNADCTNTVGAHKCHCKVGYRGDGETCNNINECSENSSSCHINSTCTDTVGSYICKCKKGFNGTGFVCNDVDNCLSNNAGCSKWANCVNTIGGEICNCKPGFEGNGAVCHLTVQTTTKGPPTTVAPSQLHVVGATIILYDVTVNGVLLDIKANITELSNMSSPLSLNLVAKIQPILLHYFMLVDPAVITVTIYKFSSPGLQKRGSLTAGQQQLKIEYSVGFNITQTSINDADLTSKLKAEVNKTNFQVDTKNFYGTILPSSIGVTTVDACTTKVLSLKHKCDVHAICTSTAGTYTCKCKENYKGNGLKCEYIETDSNFIAAIIATAVGLFLLILLLIIFLVVRKRRKRPASEDSVSSTSDVSWTPGVFGGMRARSMYTPAGLQPRQYTDSYPTDDR